MQIVVIGAGIVGLSVARTLTKLGHTVTVISDQPPMTGQSGGQGRIFRINHDNPALQQAAKEAVYMWKKWEQRYGASLLSYNGLVIDGDDPNIPGWLLDRTAVAHPPQNPLFDIPIGAVYERSGAVIDTERVTDFLSRDVKIVNDRIGAIEPGYVVGNHIGAVPADYVFVCTGSSVEQMIGLPETPLYRSVRFSFGIDQPTKGIPAWSHRHNDTCDAFYALPAGDGRYAIGMAGTFDANQWSEAEHIAAHRTRVTDIATHYFPGLIPEPIDEETVVGYYRLAPTSGQYGDTVITSNRTHGHDGWSVIRRGNTVGITGQNLFKFAPHFGAVAVAEMNKDK